MKTFDDFIEATMGWDEFKIRYNSYEANYIIDAWEDRVPSNLFIDDDRFPYESDWIILRNSREAICWISEKGLPESIAFDHDLGGEDNSMKVVRYIVEYVLDDLGTFTEGFKYSIHSQNPVGSGNIRGLMDAILAYKKV